MLQFLVRFSYIVSQVWMFLPKKKQEKIIDGIVYIFSSWLHEYIKKIKWNHNKENIKDIIKDESGTSDNINSSDPLKTKVEVAISTNLVPSYNIPTTKEKKFIEEVSSFITSDEFLDEIQDDLSKIDINKVSEEEFVYQATNLLKQRLMKKFLNKK